jgi:hypothetical protein
MSEAFSGVDGVLSMAGLSGKACGYLPSIVLGGVGALGILGFSVVLFCLLRPLAWWRWEKNIGVASS